MAQTHERIYQTSDLAGAARREFIDEATRSHAYLRTPEGESLVMMRRADLELLSDLRDGLVAYLMLDSALSRPREQRRPADFGAWAFIEGMTDKAIEEFRDEMNAVLARAASARDLSVIEKALNEWRHSARAWSDPLTRALILGELDNDWVEVDAPSRTAS